MDKELHLLPLVHLIMKQCHLMLLLSFGLSNALVPNQQTVLTRTRPLSAWSSKERETPRPCLCPQDNDVDMEDTEDLLESRRELLFATLGSLWAAASPLPAQATYGVDAKMDFPDVLQGLSDRTNKQCLVESLGNRECLVYQADSDKLLYKGADVEPLLQRLQVAAKALEEEIPRLAERKEWTKLTGVLTGPMGQLSSTMTLLTKDNPGAKSKAQLVKQDVFAMGTAATNKQGDQVMRYRQAALEHLADFIGSL